jgi:hypothetical protein
VTRIDCARKKALDPKSSGLEVASKYYRIRGDLIFVMMVGLPGCGASEPGIESAGNSKRPGKGIHLVNRTLMGAILLLLVIAGGCKSQNKSSANDENAIRAGIQRHLSESGMNVDAMNQETKKITINGDQALADVDFRTKNGDQSFGMVVEYVLQRKNGQWDVVKTQPVAGHNPAAEQPSPNSK